MEKKATANSYSVYKHTTPSGKIYIGITSKDVNQRLSQRQIQTA